MPSTCVYVVGHNDQLAAMPLPADYRRIDLRGLGLEGDRASNQLSENRLWLAPAADGLGEGFDCVAVISWRWNEKFDTKHGRTRVPIERVGQFSTVKGVVKAGLPSWGDWFKVFPHYYPGLHPLLKEGVDAGLPMAVERSGPLCNNFLAHREDYLTFLAAFRRCFDYYHAKYGLEIPFKLLRRDPKSPDHSRKAGFLYEKVALCVWLAMGVKTVTL